MLLTTNNSMFDAMSQDVARTQRRAFETHRQVATGKRVNTPADDPIAAARGALTGAALARLNSMDRVARVASAQMLTSEAVLNEVVNKLQKANELAIAGATGALSGEERSMIAEEVDVIHEFVLSAANSRQAGNYLYSGFGSDEPFIADGTYGGDSGVRQVDVAPGLRINVNQPGDQIFNAPTGRNILKDLQDLSTALRSDDIPGLHASIETTTLGQQQITSARAVLGAGLIKLEVAEAKRSDANLLLRKERSESLELDQAEGLVRMTEAQNALQTAMAAAAKVIGQMQMNPLVR